MQSAFCGTHAQSPAVATCRRCGLFLCDACVVLVREDSYCQTCAGLLAMPAPARAKAAVALPAAALLSGVAYTLPAPFAYAILLGPPLWAMGLALALAERRALKTQGENRPRRRWLRFAIVALIIAAPALLPAILFLVWIALGEPSA